MIATVAPPPSSPVRSLLNIGTTLSATQPSATPSWIASFTTLTVCNSPEKACESRTPAIKLLTPTQTPEPITHVGQSRCSPSRETAAHDRLKSPLTIAEIRTLGIWLFISANRQLTALEQVAIAVTCLSGAAEIYFFASFFLTSIPAIADQSALVPITVWAAAVLLIAIAANRHRRSAGIASSTAPAYLRTLGLITYPLYLTHNVIGTAIIRALVDAGWDATSALWIALGMLVLVCWFICAKIEPAVRSALTQTLSHFGKLPQRQPAARRPALARGLRLRPARSLSSPARAAA
jgi:hypothetical protein